MVQRVLEGVLLDFELINYPVFSDYVFLRNKWNLPKKRILLILASRVLFLKPNKEF